MIRSKLLILAILFSSISLAQNKRSISGVVLDSDSGYPLPSASVLVKGTKKGAITDFNGKFVYQISTNQDIETITLVVSFLGYKTKEVKLGNASYFEIKLQEDISALDEVVITSSYGTKKLKEEVVGSIVTIAPKEISLEQPVNTFDELLEGQVAGVYIETNPQLGEETSINIRGQGSLTPLGQNIIGTSTQPLIIVDGVILSEEVGIDGSNLFDVGTGNISENILNPLARVGVNDIESFNILKDAAAVGLYGADAANGVIIITTKSGKKGDVVFNASIQSGISNPINQFQYLNGEQYQYIVNLYNTNNGDLNNVQPWNGVNTNWQELLNRAGTFYRYSVGASGGSEHFRYRINGTYQINNEPQISNNFNKLNTSLALDYNKNKISASLRFSPSITEKNSPNTLYAFAVAPTLPVFNSNGDYTFFDTFGNPLAVANQNKRESNTLAFVNSLNVNYQITKHLKISSLFGMDFSRKDEDRFFSGLNGSGQFNDGALGRRILRDRNTNRWNWSANLFYDKTFNENHNFDALVGVETRQEKVDFVLARGDNFENFSTPQPVSLALDQDYDEDSTEATGRSVFTQVNYNFKNKYFLLANFRVDQSSVFGTDKDTALNGGLGTSWVISNEDFFESKTIDFLRLRASFGSTGNSRIGSYRALGLYTLGNNGYNGGIYANPSSAPNPNLGWERNIKFNVGIDINLLNKFKLTAEVFRDNIKDIITSRGVIPESGFTSVQINGAEMINRGIEFSLQANWIKNEEFKWNTSFNISSVENEVTALSGLGSQFSSAENARAQRIGFSTSTIWGFDFVGIDPATGRELYDIDGNIHDGAYVRQNFDESNWKPIGDSQPDVFGGLRNSLSYKGFQLDIVMSFAHGQDALLDRNLIDNYRILFNRNINVNVFEQAWQNQGNLAVYPAVSNSNPIISNSTKYLVDESHIRLRSVNLSYTLSAQKLNLPVRTLNIFLNGANLHYWFKNKSKDNLNGVAEFRSAYPEMRTISLGVNTTF